MVRAHPGTPVLSRPAFKSMKAQPSPIQERRMWKYICYKYRQTFSRLPDWVEGAFIGFCLVMTISAWVALIRLVLVELLMLWLSKDLSAAIGVAVGIGTPVLSFISAMVFEFFISDIIADKKLKKQQREREIFGDNYVS